MVFFIGAIILMFFALVGGLVRIHWEAINPFLIALNLMALAWVFVKVTLASSRQAPTPEVKPQEPISFATASSEFVSDDANAPVWERLVSGSGGTLALEIGEEEPERPSVEIADQLLRLRLELRKARAVADAFDGPAVARIRGRAHEWRGHGLALAVQDGDGHQRVSV